MFSFLVLSAVLIKLYVIFSHSSPSFSPTAADDEAEWHGNREANGLKREWRRAFGYGSYFYGFGQALLGIFAGFLLARGCHILRCSLRNTLLPELFLA